MTRFKFFIKVFATLGVVILGACEKKENKITIYTSLPERDLQELIVVFNKRHPGIKVTFFRSGTTEVMSKLQAEFMADNPKADILMLSDDIVMTGLRDEGKLASLKDVDVKELPKDSYDPKKTFFGITYLGTGLVCHKEFTPKSKSLHHLISEEMRGKVVMASPIYSGSGAINLSLIAENKDFGWPFWTKFLKNNPLFVKGNGSVLDTVAKKGRMCGVILDFLALNAIKEGASLEFFYFDEGAPVIREPIAILKSTHAFENSLLFVKFILSKEGQEKMASLGYRPIRRDISVPSIFNKVGMIKEMPMDEKKILNRLEADRVEFARAIQ